MVRRRTGPIAGFAVGGLFRAVGVGQDAVAQDAESRAHEEVVDPAEGPDIGIEPVLRAGRGVTDPGPLEGIREEDIPMMAARADKESNPLYPVPKLMDTHELEKMYRLVMA